MALAEIAGAAYIQTSTNNIQAAASFTPTANALVVAIVGVGNGNGVTATTPFLAVTSTFTGTASNTWTLLSTIHTAGNGLAGIWCMDAGSAPGAGVVTATATPSTVFDPGLIVRQFTGAAPAASQTGATGTSTGTVSTVSVTPQATGSQVVGAFGAPTVGAVTANAATTIYGQTQGNSGDTLGCFEGSSLTTATVAQVLGFTVNKAATCMAAAEILAAAGGGGAPPPVLAARPGTTWLRRFHHRQQPPLPPGPPPPQTGPPLTPLTGPVRARLPQQGLRRGHGGKSGGTRSLTGPQLRALVQPVRSKPRRGMVTGTTTGTVAVQAAPTTGPPLTPLDGPVRAQQLRPRGGRAASLDGTFSGLGPALTAADGPAGSRRAQSPRGRVAGITRAAAAPVTPVTGPPLTALDSPVRARLPRVFPARGRTLATPPPTPGMRCGVMPGYLYPTYPEWARFLASPGKLPSVVILNSGNGDVPWNTDYQALCASLHALGITVLGYTYTNFGTRPGATVNAAIGNYLGAGITPGGNGVDGIFLDEFQPTAGGFAYYAGICASIQSQFAAGGGSASPPIWGNPGSYLDSSYLALPVATFVTFENHVVAYPPPATPYNVSVSGVPQSGAGLYPRSRFAHLVYGATRDDVDGFADQAWSNYAGWAFAGPGTGDNPYSVIPANDYLNGLVTRVLGEPPAQQAGIPPATYPLHGPARARLVPPRPGRRISAAIPGLAPAVPGTGPALTPMARPAAARRLPPRGGRVTSRAGTYSGTGPALGTRGRPSRSPVYFRHLPPSGHGGHTAGLFSGTGPPLTALDTPAAPRRRTPPPIGHGGRGGAGTYSGAGPSLTAPDGPAAARRRTLPPRGQVSGIVRAAPPIQVTPTTGPALTALDGPVRARLPRQVRTSGRSVSCLAPPCSVYTATYPAVYGGAETPPAPLYPLDGPVRARLPRAARGGRTANETGTFSGTGPPLTAADGPTAPRRRNPPPRGRVTGITTAAPPVTVTPTSGPPLTALDGPVQARRPQARGGRAAAGRGIRSGTGPPLTALNGPCGRNRQGRPVPARGHGAHGPGAYAGQGPPVLPLHRPVCARLPHPVLTGRCRGTVAVGKFIPPPPFTIGTLTASGAPATALTAGQSSSALTAATAAQATLTTATQTTGGPS